MAHHSKFIGNQGRIVRELMLIFGFSVMIWVSFIRGPIRGKVLTSSDTCPSSSSFRKLCIIGNQVDIK